MVKAVHTANYMKDILEFIAFVAFMSILMAACDPKGLCVTVDNKQHCVKIE
jgi:hypothetical protein